MHITDELIDHLARLSRLEFTNQEKLELKSDLQKIANFMDILGEVDTEGVEPLTHISQAVNITREDKVTMTITSEQALQNATHTNEQFFKVPKVIQK